MASAQPLSADDATSDPLHPMGIDPSVSRFVFLFMLGISALGFLAFRLLSKPIGPPPPDVAKDSLLMQGREIYLVRVRELSWK